MDQIYTINCKGKAIDLSVPKVMAILNMTPDSFYGASRKISGYEEQIDRLISEGCDILDVGGMSSRPGASLISVDEEWERVGPAITYVSKNYAEMIVSIDTLHSEIAYRAVQEGAHIVNDISGGNHDPSMISQVADMGTPFIAMHMPGLPENMQSHTDYKDVTLEILKYFLNQEDKLRTSGIKDIIIDPGFGFGKTLDQNYELLRKLGVFKLVGAPILVGISRKSMIHKVLGVKADEALNGSTALHMIALENGASILRVHDVKEAVQCVKLHLQISSQEISH